MDDIAITIPGKVAEKIREILPGMEPWEIKVETMANLIEAYEKKTALMGKRGLCPHCQRKLTTGDRDRLGLR